METATKRTFLEWIKVGRKNKWTLYKPDQLCYTAV